jgi:hypothetical protein
MAIKDDLAKVRLLSTDIQMMAQSARTTAQPVDPIALAFVVSDVVRRRGSNRRTHRARMDQLRKALNATSLPPKVPQVASVHWDSSPLLFWKTNPPPL